MPHIAPEYYVNLKGKQYPVYAGVLLAAGEAGLQSLTTDLIQIPTADNDHVAIVKATAVFRPTDVFEHERTFSDYGDASPRNTATHLHAALIRMAATRAKGRVLRDAIGLGETLAEEVPDDHGSGPAQAWAVPAATSGSMPEADRAHPSDADFCGGCGVAITANQRALSERKFGRPLCPACQRQAPVPVAA